MSRLVRFARAAAEKPMEAVEVILALAVFLSGFWLVGPFYSPADSVSAEILESATIPHILGILHLTMSAPLLYALARLDWLKRQFVRRWATFSIFILYLFYGFSGIAVLGFERPSWLTTLAVALIAGVAHVRLKWEMVDSATRD